MRGSELHDYTDQQLAQLGGLVEAEQTRRLLEADENDQGSLTITTLGCFKLQLVRCGKPNCWCVNSIPGQEGHGPYWYRYYRRGSRLVSKYVGKHLPEEVQLAVEPTSTD